MPPGARASTPPEPEQREERIFRKPVPFPLGAKMGEQMPDLAVSDRRIQLEKDVGGPKIAIIFGNFILQDQVISKGVPGQIGD